MTTSKTMRAAVLKNYNGLLTVEERDIPTPRSGELLIKIAASPINPSDVMFTYGMYGIRKPLPAIPGFEASGVVVAVGATAAGAVAAGADVTGAGTEAVEAGVEPGRTVGAVAAISAALGGGTLAGSGTGMAASMVRGVSVAAAAGPVSARTSASAVPASIRS